MTKVLIGIQARSTSTRLPNKALMNLGNKPVLSWVINACCDSAAFVMKNNREIEVDVAILCPVGDKVGRAYESIDVVEGDEFDVLSRYEKAFRLYEPDYICRITGDCPFLNGFIITNHIFKALNWRLDYISNVTPDVRTELDGRDVEVISRKAFEWLLSNATSNEDKEHVTSLINKVKPNKLRRGHILNRIDFSDVKLSIDTDEDFANAEKRVNSFFRKKLSAEKDVGRDNVFYV